MPTAQQDPVVLKDCPLDHCFVLPSCSCCEGWICDCEHIASDNSCLSNTSCFADCVPTTNDKCLRTFFWRHDSEGMLTVRFLHHQIVPAAIQSCCFGNGLNKWVTPQWRIDNCSNGTRTNPLMLQKSMSGGKQQWWVRTCGFPLFCFVWCFPEFWRFASALVLHLHFCTPQLRTLWTQHGQTSCSEFYELNGWFDLFRTLLFDSHWSQSAKMLHHVVGCTTNCLLSTRKVHENLEQFKLFLSSKDSSCVLSLSVAMLKKFGNNQLCLMKHLFEKHHDRWRDRDRDSEGDRVNESNVGVERNEEIDRMTEMATKTTSKMAMGTSTTTVVKTLTKTVTTAETTRATWMQRDTKKQNDTDSNKDIVASATFVKWCAMTVSMATMC